MIQTYFNEIISTPDPPFPKRKFHKLSAMPSVEGDQKNLPVLYSAARAFWHAFAGTASHAFPNLPIPMRETVSCCGEKILPSGRKAGLAAAEKGVIEGGFQLSQLYSRLISESKRTAYGVFYTPPLLGEKLLDMAASAGVEWDQARVLDPASGGGAFLVPVAVRMIRSLQGEAKSRIVDLLMRNLVGMEIDPASAWLSELLLRAVVLEKLGVAVPDDHRFVKVCDTLDPDLHIQGEFDLVVGNPPFGRVKLEARRKEFFQRSLYGHANLYGLFFDRAEHIAKPSGVIAFLTPTSFLAGQYFTELRKVLSNLAPPKELAIVNTRQGVFNEVLQETVLGTYCKGTDSKGGCLASQLSLLADGEVLCEKIGKFNLPTRAGAPWIIPRRNGDATLLARLKSQGARLSDYGYRVKTGPLVWNRHKGQLRGQLGFNCYPLIWAESIRPSGVFEYRATKKNHCPFIEAKEGQEWLLQRQACVLIQRTTSKEQERRLVAAVMPNSFLTRFRGAVVENHLNILLPLDKTPTVSLEALAFILNTDLVDTVFRCISGSVAVSAYELENLPLPSIDLAHSLESMLREGDPHRKVLSELRRQYAA